MNPLLHLNNLTCNTTGLYQFILDRWLPFRFQLNKMSKLRLVKKSVMTTCKFREDNLQRFRHDKVWEAKNDHQDYWWYLPLLI